MLKKLCLDFYKACRHRASPATRLKQTTGQRVVGGPFRGMRYLDRSLGSVFSAKLLGTYEQELQPWVERCLSENHRQLWVVGCAEGYYAVGFAMRQPNLQVYAFDLDPGSHALVTELARRNGVDSRVHFQGEFSAASLTDSDRGLLICDIEGDETELLCPRKIPALLQQNILVEVHDANDGSIENVLRDRFSPSHKIEKTCARVRTLRDLEPLARACLPLGSKDKLVDEQRRHGLSWLLLTPQKERLPLSLPALAPPITARPAYTITFSQPLECRRGMMRWRLASLSRRSARPRWTASQPARGSFTPSSCWPWWDGEAGWPLQDKKKPPLFSRARASFAASRL